MAASRPCPAANKSVARKISSVVAQLPISNAVTPIISRPSGPASTGRTLTRTGRWCRSFGTAVRRIAYTIAAADSRPGTLRNSRPSLEVTR